MQNSSYKFDFDHETKAAFRKFPAQAAQTAFVYLGHSDARQKIYEWHLQRLTSPLKLRAGNGPLSRLINGIKRFARSLDITQWKEEARQLSENCTYSLCFPDPSAGKFLLVVSDQPELGIFKSDKDPYYRFWHEFGHVLFPAPIKKDTLHPQELIRENEKHADVFAVLTGLQEGVFNREDTRKISNMRALRALCGRTTHFTSESLDDIALDLHQIDLKKASAQDLVSLTKKYARKNARCPEDHKKAEAPLAKASHLPWHKRALKHMATQRPLTHQQRIGALFAERCQRILLTKPVGTLEHEIAVRCIPVLKRGHI